MRPSTGPDVLEAMVRNHCDAQCVAHVGSVSAVSPSHVQYGSRLGIACVWYAGPGGEGRFIWVPVNERTGYELGAYPRVFEEEVGVADHGEHSDTICDCEL